MRINTLELPSKSAPDNTQRRVVWNTDSKGGNAVLLVGYCPQTLPYYLGLVEDLLKTFPKADLKKVIFGQVTHSPSVKGFTVLIAPIAGPKREIPGYTRYESLGFNY
jgi:hypothetical protein